MSLSHIAPNQDQLQALCERWGIRQVSLFGSVLDDTFRADSDVDVLISFEPSSKPSAFDLVSIADELEEILSHRVDLHTRAGVEASRNPYRRQTILDAAKVIYEQ